MADPGEKEKGAYGTCTLHVHVTSHVHQNSFYYPHVHVYQFTIHCVCPKTTDSDYSSLTLLLTDNLKPFKNSTFKNAHWFCTHMVIPFEQCWYSSKLYYHSNPF